MARWQKWDIASIDNPQSMNTINTSMTIYRSHRIIPASHLSKVAFKPGVPNDVPSNGPVLPYAKRFSSGDDDNADPTSVEI
ncbi:hypothetical protein PENANT_c017G05463 [Penicillium antarcticum]|uniref:Uncharacterized protein n=1 Tax=Penicillium antarcticum TaxID=416450 RepID=A0A1V6Q289_9EURO|nr:hypothetical protein PENANT_c017G05463 [Penicillium antarcticum]